MQGWRISMEDAHTTVLDLLANNPKEAKDHSQKLSFFGVYDGHGGDKVALFAGANIHDIVAKQDTFKTGNYEQALKDGFLATDRAILNGTILNSPHIGICGLPGLCCAMLHTVRNAREKKRAKKLIFAPLMLQIPNTRRRFLGAPHASVLSPMINSMW